MTGVDLENRGFKRERELFLDFLLCLNWFLLICICGCIYGWNGSE